MAAARRSAMSDGAGDPPVIGEPLSEQGNRADELVGEQASGLLERKTRRGFLIGSAMAGSAVAVTGCQVVTTRLSLYPHHQARRP